jgi:antitoxin component HigA of HigAB toxin-antitoxin module
MRKSGAHPSKQLPRTFNDLNAMYPLRPIRENAYEVVDRLAVINKPTKDQTDYLNSLVTLTEAFDKEDNEAALASGEKVSGLELLKYVMENTNMTQVALARILGVSEGAASMILKGARSITAEHARTLGKHFKLDPGAFIR